MSVFSRRAVFTFICVVLSVFTLAAGTYYIEWTPGDYFSGADNVRYKIDSSSWKELPTDGGTVLSTVYAKESTVKFETSSDGETWTESLKAKLIVAEPGAEETYSLTWKWNEVPGAQRIRYSLDGKGWLYLPNDATGYKDSFEANRMRVFRAETTLNDVDWIDGAEKGVIIAEKQAIRNPRKFQVSLLGSLTFEDVYFSETKSAIKSELGYGGKLSLFFPFSKANGLVIDNDFSVYRLGVRNIMEYDPQLKLRFGAYDERGVALYFMIGGGASMIMRDGRYYFYPAASADLGFDYWFSKQLALTANAGASVSIQNDRLFNPGVLIDSLSIHAAGFVGITYALCAKGGNK